MARSPGRKFLFPDPGAGGAGGAHFSFPSQQRAAGGGGSQSPRPVLTVARAARWSRVHSPNSLGRAGLGLRTRGPGTSESQTWRCRDRAPPRGEEAP